MLTTGQPGSLSPGEGQRNQWQQNACLLGEGYCLVVTALRVDTPVSSLSTWNKNTGTQTHDILTLVAAKYTTNPAFYRNSPSIEKQYFKICRCRGRPSEIPLYISWLDYIIAFFLLTVQYFRPS